MNTQSDQNKKNRSSKQSDDPIKISQQTGSQKGEEGGPSTDRKNSDPPHEPIDQIPPSSGFFASAKIFGGIILGVFAFFTLLGNLSGKYVLIIALLCFISILFLAYGSWAYKTSQNPTDKHIIKIGTYCFIAIMVLILMLSSIPWTRIHIVYPLGGYDTPTPTSTPTLMPAPTETVTPVLHTVTLAITPSTIITLTNTTTITPTSSETPTPTTTPTSTIVPPSSIKIGIIDVGVDYAFRDIADRLSGFGYYVEWIPPDSDYYKLELFDIIYLPSGWSAVNQQIERRANDYLNYLNLKTQVGLWVEQPNFNGAFIPKILPFEIEFTDNGYHRNDWPPNVIDSNHYITRDLPEGEMPGSMDRISKVDGRYGILVRGRTSLSPSLIFSNYSNNRILVSAGNTSTSSSVPYQISDQVLQRMIEWLAGAK